MEEKSFSEIILDITRMIGFIILLISVLSMLCKSLELEENYTKEMINLQERQVEILEKIEDKIY